METLTARRNLSKLTALCVKNGVVHLTVFGAALRDDFSEKSDRDFVVEFGPSQGFTESHRFFSFAEELEALSGHKVDLVERNGSRTLTSKRA